MAVEPDGSEAGPGAPAPPDGGTASEGYRPGYEGGGGLDAPPPISGQTMAGREVTGGVPPDELTGPPVGGTRTAATWAALAAGLFFLIVVLVFILQNLKSVRVHFFWATWSIPLAVDLLLATVLGGLVMFTAGSLRILQLRRAARQAGAGHRASWRHPGNAGHRRGEREVARTGTPH